VRVVFDTNVYISAFGIPGSKSEDAFLLTLKEEMNLFISVSILTEIANVLKNKFKFSNEIIQTTLKYISQIARVIKPQRSIKVLKDEPDNRILECAIEAKADFIVTGDKHIKQLNEYKGIKIVSVSEFLELASQYKIK